MVVFYELNESNLSDPRNLRRMINGAARYSYNFYLLSKMLPFNNFTKARLFRYNQQIYLLQMHAIFGKH